MSSAATSGTMQIALTRLDFPTSTRRRTDSSAPRVKGLAMSFKVRSLFLVIGCLTAASTAAHGQEKQPYNGPAYSRNLDDYFVKEVWTKVGAALCLQCHKQGGDAEESKFVLKDLSKLQGHAQEEAL